MTRAKPWLKSGPGFSWLTCHWGNYIFCPEERFDKTLATLFIICTTCAERHGISSKTMSCAGLCRCFTLTRANRIVSYNLVGWQRGKEHIYKSKVQFGIILAEKTVKNYRPCFHSFTQRMNDWVMMLMYDFVHCSALCACTTGVHVHFSYYSTAQGNFNISSFRSFNVITRPVHLSSDSEWFNLLFPFNDK